MRTNGTLLTRRRQRGSRMMRFFLGRTDVKGTVIDIVVITVAKVCLVKTDIAEMSAVMLAAIGGIMAGLAEIEEIGIAVNRIDTELP